MRTSRTERQTIASRRTSTGSHSLCPSNERGDTCCLRSVLTIIDALVWPARAFYVAGSNKTAWVIVLAGATVLGIGAFLGAWYLLGATAPGDAAIENQLARGRSSCPQPINQIRTCSGRSCQRTSIGNRSRHSRLRPASPSWSVIRQSPALTLCGSKCPRGSNSCRTDTTRTGSTRSYPVSSTSGGAISSMRRSWRRFRRAASSCFRAVRLIFTGPSRVTT